MNIWKIAETVNTDTETVRKVLHDELNMKKVCAKFVPKNLTLDQKLIHQQICSDFLERPIFHYDGFDDVHHNLHAGCFWLASSR